MISESDVCLFYRICWRFIFNNVCFTPALMMMMRIICRASGWYLSYEQKTSSLNILVFLNLNWTYEITKSLGCLKIYHYIIWKGRPGRPLRSSNVSKKRIISVWWQGKVRSFGLVLFQWYLLLKTKSILLNNLLFYSISLHIDFTPI